MLFPRFTRFLRIAPKNIFLGMLPNCSFPLTIRHFSYFMPSNVDPLAICLVFGSRFVFRKFGSKKDMSVPFRSHFKNDFFNDFPVGEDLLIGDASLLMEPIHLLKLRKHSHTYLADVLARRNAASLTHCTRLNPSATRSGSRQEWGRRSLFRTPASCMGRG